MKVIFIQPFYNNVWEALGLGYIIAYCKKHYKGELEINFFQGKFDNDTTIVEGALDSDIVAFSCTSPAYHHGLNLARALKHLNPKIHTVFGGWHPTALPMDVFQEKGVDQVIIGEGEHAMLRILNGERCNILQGDKLPPEELPWPDRSTIRNNRTIFLCQEMNGKRTASFQMNRGCKVHCKFCAEQGMSGKYNRETNPIRTRNINDLLDEIETATKEYALDYIKFTDATFDIDFQTVMEFCNLKISRGNKTKWECNIHPGFIQLEEVFNYLSHANCDQINIGVESGSPRILKDVGKGTSLESIKNVFRWAKKYGIKRRGFFLLGMINEKEHDIQLTEDLIDEIKPDVLGFTILCPYPGSSLYSHEKHKDIDWSKTDEYGNDFWRSKELTNSQLKNWQHYFMERYPELLCERQDKQSGIV